MSESETAPLTQSAFMRFLVLSPLLLSFAAAVMLMAVAPLAWGAADEFGLASWVPSVSALMLTLPALAASGWGLRSVWRRMTGLFDVDMVGAAVGGISHWAASICLVTFAGTIGSRESYRSLVDEGTGTAGMLFMVTIAAIIGGVLFWGLTMVYVQAVTAGPKTHIAQRRPDEVDFVEEWGRRHGPRV